MEFIKEENIEESFGLDSCSAIKPKKSKKRTAPSKNNCKITDVFKRICT